MYKDIPARQRRKLPDSPKWKYFKEYKHTQKDGMQPATVFKQLHHCPSKQMPSTGSTFNFLPPLPPNFAGDARVYYQTHHRINLDIPSICERYQRDSLALAGIAHCDQIMSYIDTIKNVPQKTVQDVTLDHHHDDRVYVISPEDTALLATPNTYLRRIHTPLTPLSDSAPKRLRLSQAPSSSTAATSFTPRSSHTTGYTVDHQGSTQTGSLPTPTPDRIK
ncbi:hypothetical protein RCL_jg15821.t1 [Rhizophagus clarus]|uniref:Uncharacterized protein n=1 Tax=Rhizophagus clarus TaxID=94130 RepID=A0A8H3R6Z7_9GLOM|nr:hypothetical protein RCL_jg15821.t1 [Rhizophagus clarus]